MYVNVFQSEDMKGAENTDVRLRPGDRGNWRRKYITGRSANIEMDFLDARFTSKRVDLNSCKIRAYMR